MLKPPMETHRLVQRPGRPRYWLPKEPSALRAAIERFVRDHEKIYHQMKSKTVTN